jgi:DNA polymerase
MDTKRRRQYLEALGVESWRRRAGAAGTEAVTGPAMVAASPAAAAEHPATEPVMPSVLAAGATVRTVPQDWEGLQSAVSGCTHCKLCKTRTKTVFGVGSPAAPLMVVGEGPGADEDAQGEPFVGRAGKLLDEMLRAIGRERRAADAGQAVYIANVVKCRPPGNRDPEADEVQACRPYLDQQLRLVRPRLIVALGRVAAQRLLATDAPLSRLRGPLYEYGPEHTPVLVTYHPAYLLRSPGEKAKSWADLKRIHQLLQAPG